MDSGMRRNDSCEIVSLRPLACSVVYFSLTESAARATMNLSIGAEDMVEITKEQLFVSCLAVSRIIEEYDETELSAFFGRTVQEMEDILAQLDEIAEKVKGN